MRKILLLMLFLTSAAGAFAQNRMRAPYLGIGVEGNLPLGNFGDAFGSGVGAVLQLSFPVDPHISVTASGGYNQYFPTKALNAIGYSSIGYLPLKLGGRYYFHPSFFVMGEIGATISTAEAGTAFIYAPGIGALLSDRIEASFRFEGWTYQASLNQVALRLAYRFPL
ncbi:MAG: hypothetical protein INR69_10010 [Mucilaginibacter polytrichastri]|nr:hypothetical protein [Mucilaginibacter polytrichastri]